MIFPIGNGEQKGNPNFVYRYFYVDVSQDGKISNPLVLFSKTNIAGFIDDVRSGRYIPNKEYTNAIGSILFSRENIEKSLANETLYIGKLRHGSYNKLELEGDASNKTECEYYKKALNFPIKQFRRDDGSCFVVQRMVKGKNVNGIEVNRYNIFELVTIDRRAST